MGTLRSHNGTEDVRQLATRGKLCVSLAGALGLRAAVHMMLRAETAFAHVLNMPETEVVWPGEAADLFFPQLFAVAPDGCAPYADCSYLAEHMRCELLRMACEAGMSTLEQMEQDVRLFIMMESAFLSFEKDEEDTLNSELLLTQVYVPPQDVPTSWKTPPTTTDIPSKLPGACDPTAGSTPTEKED